ncbi:MAG: calcium/sodium antiporter [Clostridia bacterium]|nr:calcium/sodium antiporter [Clostridia bacterium]
MYAFLTYALFAAGIIILVKCADTFVDSASYFARATGIPEFIVGATVVSFGTTLPEIIVSSMAAFDARKLCEYGLYEKAAEKVGMAVGNGIGSVTANTALILALSIIFMPVKIDGASFFKKAFILISSVLCLWCVTAFTGELRLWGSALLVAAFIVFMIESAVASKAEKSNVEDLPQTDRKSFMVNIAKLVFGAVGIMLGSHLLVKHGSEIAFRAGVSESVIGITAVAVGTSLPELAATLSALFKKQTSLSAGNIIGANIIDVALILPISSFIYSGNLPVSKANILLDFPVCVLVTVAALVPALIKKRFFRFQGIILLAVYSFYIAAVCIM